MPQLKTLEDLRKVLAEPRQSTMAKIQPALDAQARDFVARCSYLLLSTIDARGQIEVSPKGDEPGFVRVENDTTLLMPERAGNNLAFGLQNILLNGQVGMIFLLPQTGETLRVSGKAELFDDPELLARLSSQGKPALLAIRIHVLRSYFHCARASLRSKLWDPQAWPEAGRVSFGKIIAPRVGGDDAMAREIDERVAGSYSDRLWTNG